MNNEIRTGKVVVTLTKSPYGRSRKHRACVVGLGLRRLGSVAALDLTPAVQGMINEISYLIRVSKYEA